MRGREGRKGRKGRQERAKTEGRKEKGGGRPSLVVMGKMLPHKSKNQIP